MASIRRYAQAPPPPPPANVRRSSPSRRERFFTVRVNQVLSSDHNQAGDAFSATLVKPIVVNGMSSPTAAKTIQGRVSEAKKAGRVSGTSRLGVELTDLIAGRRQTKSPSKPIGEPQRTYFGRP